MYEKVMTAEVELYRDTVRRIVHQMHAEGIPCFRAAVVKYRTALVDTGTTNYAVTRAVIRVCDDLLKGTD